MLQTPAGHVDAESPREREAYIFAASIWFSRSYHLEFQSLFALTGHELHTR
jgi:hypothetical protein